MTKLLIPRPASMEVRQSSPLRATNRRLRGTLEKQVTPQQRPPAPPTAPTRQMIEKRAYYIYLERGTAGDPQVDWAVAEQQAWAEYHLERKAYEAACEQTTPAS